MESSLRFLEHYNAECHACPLHPGAAEFLRQLWSAQIGSSILSAAEAHTINRLLAHQNISHLFDQVSGVDNPTPMGELG